MKKILAVFVLFPCMALAQYTVPTFTAGALGTTPQAAAPTFSPAAGAISSGTTIAITSATSGVTICYTLNGDTPTAATPGTCDSDSGNEHSISNGGSTSGITTNLTVKAIATIASGYTNSTVASAAYTISAGFTVLGCASNMKTSGGTTLTVTYSPTAGNALIAATLPTYPGGGTSTVKLSNGSSLTTDSLVTPGSEIYIGHYLSVPSGITGVTLTQGSANKATMIVCEVSGLTHGLDVADTTGAYSTTTSWTSGTTATTTNANDIVFGYCDDDTGNPTVHPTMTGYTIPTNAYIGAQYNQWGVMGYLVVSSTGTQTASGTLNYAGQTTGIVAAYY